MKRCYPFLTILTISACALVAYEAFRSASAQQKKDWHEGLPRQHKSKWLVHDLRRPKPKVVAPGETAHHPPADAIVLFDGKDLSQWRGQREGSEAKWKVENGYMEVNNTGDILTKEKFGDCQLHLEFMEPAPAQRGDQYRGNSGIIFMTRYELQVLDNYENKTYADGYCGAIYGQHPPMANANRKPGEWQVYDVVFRAPRFKDGELEEPARITAFLNGVLVQHHGEVFGGVAWRRLASYKAHAAQDHLRLQDHGDRQKVRYRNIWVRPLDLSPSE